MSSKRIVVIGSSIAGISAAEAARKADPEAEISVYSDDSHLPYYRLRICEVLMNSENKKNLALHPEEWYKERKIGLHLNKLLKVFNPDKKELEFESGEKVGYDKLIIAAGSKSFVPPIKGSELPGVKTLWTMDDAIETEALLSEVSSAAVIGGGLLGLEAAYALGRRGIDTTILERSDRLLARQLTEKASEIFKNQLEEKYAKLVTNADTSEIQADADGNVKGVLLSDGRFVPAELVIISTGVRARLTPFKDSLIDIDRCIVVDERMKTNIEDVFAAGDIAILDSRWYGLWSISRSQGLVAGKNAAGGDESMYMPVPPYVVNTMGTKICSAGLHQIPETAEKGDFKEDEKIDEENPGSYSYKLYKKEKLAGYVLLGNTSEFASLNKELNN